MKDLLMKNLLTKDVLIDIMVTLLSTLILALWSGWIIKPYYQHQEIYKKVLKLIRDFTDPRKFEEQILPHSLEIDCISNQLDEIDGILDLILEQRDLHIFLYKMFGYKKVVEKLRFLYEYIRAPVMLRNQKEFTDDYNLDSELFFKDLKKTAKFPWIRFVVLGLVLICILRVIIIGVMHLVLTFNPA